MSLRAGKLRHVVQVQEKTTVVDSNGDRVEVWAVVFPRVYASIEPLSAKELMAVGAEQSEVVARIQVRYRPGFNHGQRIVHRGEIYHIQGVQRDNESGEEWLTLPVSQGLRDADPITP